MARRYEDGGLIGRAKAGLAGRAQKLDAAEAQAVGLRAPVPATALAPKPAEPVQKPITSDEAMAKAARFKWELDHPGVPYVPPKMASGGYIGSQPVEGHDINAQSLGLAPAFVNGGYLPFRSQSPFIDSTTPPPQGIPGKPTPGLQDNYADGGEIGSFYGLEDHSRIAPDTWTFPAEGSGHHDGNTAEQRGYVGYADGGAVLRNGLRVTYFLGGPHGGMTIAAPSTDFVQGGDFDVGAEYGRGLRTPFLRSYAQGGFVDNILEDSRFQMVRPKAMMQPPPMPVMGGYAAGPVVDPAASVDHGPAGVRVMGANGAWESPKDQTLWQPDTADKRRQYIEAVAANQRAGSTFGGKSAAETASTPYQSNDTQWNDMVKSVKTGPGGYPMVADGGEIGLAPARGHLRRRYANGGKLGKPKMSPSDGGVLTGKGGPTEDKQPILASPGEYVIPADSVKEIGKEKLDAMVDATHKPVEREGMRGFANGDQVPTWQRWMNRGKGFFGAAKDVAGAAVDAGKEAAQEIDWPKIGDNEPAAQPRPSSFRNYTNISPEGAPYSPLGAETVRPLGPGSTTPSSIPGMRGYTPPPPAAAPGAWDALQGRMAPGFGQDIEFGKMGQAVKRSLTTGAVGKAARVGGKLLAVAAPVMEGVDYARDKEFLDQLPGGTEAAIARAGLRLGTGALGAGLGSVVGPVGTVAGGIGGYKLGNAIAEGLAPQTALARNLSENRDFIEQKTAEVKARQAAKQAEADQAKAVPVPVEAKKEAPPEDTTFQDVMAAAAKGAGAGGEAAPAKTTEQANADAKAQMAAMDAANAQKGAAENARLDRMTSANTLAQTKYEADVAAENAKRFPYDKGLTRDFAQKLGRLQTAQGQAEALRTREAQRVEGQLQREAAMKQAQLASETALKGHEMGLRGAMYGANVNLASHLADRKLQYLMWQRQMQEARDKESTDFIDKVTQQPEIDPKTGQPTGRFVTNEPMAAALRREALAGVDAHGNRLIDPLTPSSTANRQIEGVKRLIDVSQEVDPSLYGAPIGAQYRPLEWNDWSFLHPEGAAQHSNVGLTDIAKGKWLPNALVGAAADKALVVNTRGGKPMITTGTRVQSPGGRDTLARLLDQYSALQGAQYRQDTGLPK